METEIDQLIDELFDGEPFIESDEKQQIRLNRMGRKNGIHLQLIDGYCMNGIITTLPPQVGLDKKYEYLCSSQINTYEISQRKK
jgi:hypothetical protein